MSGANLDFTNVFSWNSQSVEVWEREYSTDGRGISAGREVDSSRRQVLMMVTTETDFRAKFQAEGDHAEGTVDVHIMPPDMFYTKERDNKQTYFTFGSYTFKVADIIPVNATHLSYRAVRFNDPGDDRY
jgi:hypothetical protein